MTSMAEIRRRKKIARQRAEEMGLTLTPSKKRQPNGDFRRSNDSPTDPRRTALDARCKIAGVVATKSARTALSAAYSGCGVGLCIQQAYAGHKRQHEMASRLWSVWQDYCMAHRTYMLRVIGTDGMPAGAQIMATPDPVEIDPSLTADTRSTDEKDADAVRRLEAWNGLLVQIDHRHAMLIGQARRMADDALWIDAAPTPTGREVVKALMALADVAEGR